jgi:hypothetical protein
VSKSPASFLTTSPEDNNYSNRYLLVLSIFFGEIYIEKQYKICYDLYMHYDPVWIQYMNSFRNDVFDLFVNTHVRIKIYLEFNHGIIYIANERRHVRILDKLRWNVFLEMDSIRK